MEDRERDLGLETAGVWNTTAARAAGLSEDDIRGRVAAGEWQQLRKGTYADGGVVPDAFMRASSAVQAAATVRRVAVAAGRTAARMWGIPLVDDNDPATRRFEHVHDDVVLTFGETTGRTLHSRQLQLGAEDVCLLRGIPVLTLHRTLLDLPNVLRPDALVCALDFVLHSGWASEAELAALARSGTGRPGVGRPVPSTRPRRPARGVAARDVDATAPQAAPAGFALPSGALRPRDATGRPAGPGR